MTMFNGEEIREKLQDHLSRLQVQTQIEGQESPREEEMPQANDEQPQEG